MAHSTNAKEGTKESIIKYDAPISTAPVVDKYGNKVQSAHENVSKVEEMLYAMIPPREWTDKDGKTWKQCPSKEPASRLDVTSLQEQLDKKLSERKARESGICYVREELYGQCMDEIIRHVTLDGPERGLLLMRARDEIRMTIDAYKTLFKSSVNFGIKKNLTSEHGIPELEAQVAELEKEKAALDLTVYELKAKLDMVEKHEAERRVADDKQRKEELDFLQHKKQQLEAILKQMTAAK